MEQKNLERLITRVLVATMTLMAMLTMLGFGLLYYITHPELLTARPAPAPVVAMAAPEPEPDRVENGIDVASGFIAEGDYMLVKTTCTACHSSKLVLQNRATREGWKEMIVWMQQTQKLWDLGENEDKVLDYLAKHYGPVKKGRRAPLIIEDWYEISSN